MQEFWQNVRLFQKNARLYLWSNALSGVTIGMGGLVYNLYLSQLGFKEDFQGWLYLVVAIGAALMLFPAGYCYDRFGSKRLLILASLGIGFAGAGQFLFRSPVPLLVSGFLAGMCGAFILIVNLPFLTANSTPRERPLLFSINLVATLVMTVIGGLIGGFLTDWLLGQSWLMGATEGPLNWILVAPGKARAYQLTLLISGLIALPSFIPLFFLTETKKQAVVIGLKEESKNSWLGDIKQGWQQVCAWRSWIGSALVILLITWALTGFGAGLFVRYLNIFFVEHLGASTGWFSVVDGAANVLHAVMLLLAPWVATRIGRVNTIIWSRLLSLPLLLGLSVMNLPLASVLYPARQGLMDMSMGIWQIFSMDVVKAERRGLANSSYQAVWQGAQVLAFPLGGILIKQGGYASVFVLATICYGATVFLLWWRFGRQQVGERDGQSSAALE